MPQVVVGVGRTRSCARAPRAGPRWLPWRRGSPDAAWPGRRCRGTSSTARSSAGRAPGRRSPTPAPAAAGGRSPATLPDAASSTSAASVTVRASTPLTVMPLNASGSGQVEIRPRCGLMPTRCVHAAGMRTLPAPSEPIAAATRPAATAAALPPDDPPGVCSRDHGLRVCPKRRPAGERPLTQLAGVGLADDDRARGPQPAHDFGVLGAGRIVPAGAEPGRHARDVDVVLDRDRDAEQRKLFCPPRVCGRPRRRRPAPGRSAPPGTRSASAGWPSIASSDRRTSSSDVTVPLASW